MKQTNTISNNNIKFFNIKQKFVDYLTAKGVKRILSNYNNESTGIGRRTYVGPLNIIINNKSIDMYVPLTHTLDYINRDKNASNNDDIIISEDEAYKSAMLLSRAIYINTEMAKEFLVSYTEDNISKQKNLDRYLFQKDYFSNNENIKAIIEKLNKVSSKINTDSMEEIYTNHSVEDINNARIVFDQNNKPKIMDYTPIFNEVKIRVESLSKKTKEENSPFSKPTSNLFEPLANSIESMSASSEKRPSNAPTTNNRNSSDVKNNEKSEQNNSLTPYDELLTHANKIWKKKKKGRKPVIKVGTKKDTLIDIIDKAIAHTELSENEESIIRNESVYQQNLALINLLKISNMYLSTEADANNPEILNNYLTAFKAIVPYANKIYYIKNNKTDLLQNSIKLKELNRSKEKNFRTLNNLYIDCKLARDEYLNTLNSVLKAKNSPPTESEKIDNIELSNLLFSPAFRVLINETVTLCFDTLKRREFKEYSNVKNLLATCNESIQKINTAASRTVTLMNKIKANYYLTAENKISQKEYDDLLNECDEILISDISHYYCVAASDKSNNPATWKQYSDQLFLLLSIKQKDFEEKINRIFNITKPDYNKESAYHSDINSMEKTPQNLALIPKGH